MALDRASDEASSPETSNDLNGISVSKGNVYESNFEGAYHRLEVGTYDGQWGGFPPLLSSNVIFASLSSSLSWGTLM